MKMLDGTFKEEAEEEEAETDDRYDTPISAEPVREEEGRGNKDSDGKRPESPRSLKRARLRVKERCKLQNITHFLKELIKKSKKHHFLL